MSQLVRITAVEPLRDLVVRLDFTNGESREVDLAPYLQGPIFDDLVRDRDLFRRVAVDPRAKTICWPNGADICPDVLYYGLTSAWREAEGAPLTAADLAFRRGAGLPLSGLAGDHETHRETERN